MSVSASAFRDRADVQQRMVDGVKRRNFVLNYLMKKQDIRQENKSLQNPSPIA